MVDYKAEFLLNYGSLPDEVQGIIDEDEFDGCYCIVIYRYGNVEDWAIHEFDYFDDEIDDAPIKWFVKQINRAYQYGREDGYANNTTDETDELRRRLRSFVNTKKEATSPTS